MSLDLYVDSAAVELSAELPAIALATLPSPTLSLLAGGYSLAGADPGPKGFPEISLPPIEEEP